MRQTEKEEQAMSVLDLSFEKQEQALQSIYEDHPVLTAIYIAAHTDDLIEKSNLFIASFEHYRQCGVTTTFYPLQMKDIARSTQTAVLKSLLDHYPKLTTQYLTLASNTLIFLSFPPKQPITISEFDLYPWRESTRSSYENFLTDELDILRTETRRQTSKNMKVFLWWCNSWIFSFGLFSSKDPERKPVVVERWRDFDPREWENKIRRPKDFLTREAFEDIFVLKD